MKNRKKQMNDQHCGFTLVELIIVVFVLAITALVAVPMFTSAADVQVRSTANRIAADLDYARGMAITRQKNFWVIFNDVAESYEIWWHNPQTDIDEIFKNPLTGGNFLVNLPADSRSGNVNIHSVDFDAATAITFDYLGTPYAGIGSVPGSRLSNEGVITLKSKDGQFLITVKVEPLTGCVTVE